VAGDVFPGGQRAKAIGNSKNGGESVEFEGQLRADVIIQDGLPGVEEG